MSGAEQGIKLKSPTSPVSDISTNFLLHLVFLARPHLSPCHFILPRENKESAFLACYPTKAKVIKLCSFLLSSLFPEPASQSYCAGQYKEQVCRYCGV